jgi:hypothetical protein
MTYQLRYSFDTGSGICLWPDNAAAQARFGYAIDLRELELPDAIVAEGEQLLERWDTWMDWDNAPAALWTDEQFDAFATASKAFLLVLRASLGPDFEIG